MVKFGAIFLIVLVGAALTLLIPTRTGTVEPSRAGGVATNERITAFTGAPLYVLLVLIGVTILFLSSLLPLHYAIGLLLVPPIVLKVGSTGYRFVRYYTGDRGYRLAGAPSLILRLTGPILVAATVAVFASGIELWLFGLRFGSAWKTAHTLSAVIMIAAVGVHLAGHLRRSVVVAAEELDAGRSADADDAGLGRIGHDPSPRRAVAASIVLGIAMAIASFLYATPFPPSAAGG
jgi:hypothetical protein